jgi:concentrative nucleoside transporter, CNT family
LFYWRILPPIVRGLSRALEHTLDVGGAAGLSTAANIFVGQVEAPLFIRPYLDKLSRSEMFIVMTGGMAGIAGTIFVLYATILANAIPNAAGHIAVCSVLGAPAAAVISLLPTRTAGTPAAGSTTSSRLQVGQWTRSCKAPAKGLSFFLTSSPC